MKDNERYAFISNSKKLSGLIDELLKKEFTITGWCEIDKEISRAFEYFKGILEVYKIQLDKLITSSTNTSYDYQDYCEWLDCLYQKIDICTQMVGRFFKDIKHTLLSQYLFVNNLLNTFQPKMRNNIHIVLSEDGYYSHSEIAKQIIEIDYWIDQPCRKQLEQLSSENNIHWVGIAIGQYLHKQIVVSHELFHAFIRNNDMLRNYLEQINLNKNEIGVGEIKELFCDYASAWHFGPCYLAGFLDEIRYIKKNKDTQLKRILRAKIVMAAFNADYNHSMISELAQFIDNYNHEDEISEELVQEIAESFSKYLSVDLQMKKYHAEDKSIVMAKYLKNRLPFFFTDIRDFLNNLPVFDDITDSDDKKHFPIFISESLRISYMLNEFLSAAKDVKNDVGGMDLTIRPAFIIENNKSEVIIEKFKDENRINEKIKQIFPEILKKKRLDFQNIINESTLHGWENEISEKLCLEYQAAARGKKTQIDLFIENKRPEIESFLNKKINNLKQMSIIKDNI